MAQLFPPSMNWIVRTVVASVFVLPVVALFGVYGVLRSPWQTDEGLVVDQRVPFSHEHHVRGLGIDCRYCHTSVEAASYAGIPPTKTCMTCHSQIWYDAPMLQGVRDSWNANRPLIWNQVHNLPDYVYFDHSIHVTKGIGCTTCHGQVDQMPLMKKGASLQMRWCLQCHRDPAAYIRPREEVFSMTWQPPANQRELGESLVKRYQIRKEQLQDCSVCHR